MARGKIKKARKGKAPRTSLAFDIKYLGGEPEWTDINLGTPEVYRLEMHKALNWYNYFKETHQLKKDVLEYINTQTKWPERAVKAYKNTPKNPFAIAYAALARMTNRHFPLSDADHERLQNKLREAILDVDPGAFVKEKKKKTVIKVNKKKTPAKSIQDHMLDQARTIAGEIDGLIDKLFHKEKADFDLYQFLVEKQISKPVASKLRGFYEKEFEEIKTSKEKKADPQLAEGYAFVKPRHFKNIIAWYEKLFADFDQYVKHKNIHRKPRKKKPVSVEKLVSKLKFLKEHKEYKLVSIPPTKIIGAEQLWIFNVKTRKLGRFIAEDHNQLSIKGQKIIGYDPVKSISKTIRKPKEKLPELMKAGKVTLRKFLDDIRATSVQMRGKINKDMILLRVE